jgi:hypothetical protein
MWSRYRVWRTGRARRPRSTPLSSAQRITASAASAERSEVLVRCKPKLASVWVRVLVGIGGLPEVSGLDNHLPVTFGAKHRRLEADELSFAQP